MFLIVYLFHNRDVFGPSSIVCGVFVFCSYIAIYSSQRLNLNLSFKAYSLLVYGISSISITSILISVFYKLNYKNTNLFLETNITYIKIYNRKLIISICSILFLISLISQIKLALSISGGSLSNLIYAYRMEMLSGTERIPSIVSNMETVNYAIGYLAIYILVNNFFVIKKVDSLLLLIIIYPCAIGILSGSRGEIIHYFIFFLIIYYYYINLNVLKIIIHELNHAKQYKKLNSNINDEETFLYKICTRTLEEMYYTSNIHIKSSADYYNLLCIKDSLYIIDPMERMAEFKSLSNTRKLILNNGIIPQKINNIFSLTQTNLILKVHKNEYLSPTIKFLDEMKYEDDLNKFKFYNGVIDKEFLKSFSIYDYAKRIFYGYPITEEEYNVNREFKKYLIREIKK